MSNYGQTVVAQSPQLEIVKPNPQFAANPKLSLLQRSHFNNQNALNLILRTNAPNPDSKKWLGTGKSWNESYRFREISWEPTSCTANSVFSIKMHGNP